MTFINYYWLGADSVPSPRSGKVVCVHYSVAKGGLMIAGRFQGEAALTAEHFVQA